MPQSSQPWGMQGRFMWGDWEVTERQLAKYWALLGERAGFNPLRVVTAGISKGGEVAVWLALSGRVPACGFLVVAPGGPRIAEPGLLLPFMPAARERGLRGYLIVGGQDHLCYQPTMRLAEFLKDQGIPHRVEQHPELGHWFPPDFAHSLKQGLDFILDGA